VVPTIVVLGGKVDMLITRALIVVLLVVVALTPVAPIVRAATPDRPAASDAPARALPVGNRIPWRGQNWFFSGANVAWMNWGRDFGGGHDGGVSAPDNRAKLGERFATAKASGVNVLRWWTFEGDPWQITRDEGGAPNGLDEAIYQDFDAALELAEEHDLYYVFVLFSGPAALPPSWLNDSAQRLQLANALGPLFARYKDNPRVMTWEVFNEPDNDVWRKGVREESMRMTTREIVDSIHANSSAYATIGMMMLDGLPMSKGLGLDYYQAHWYDTMPSGDWCAMCTNYEAVKAKYDLDAPLVIGETYLGPDIENAHLRLDDLYNKGYAGAWPWSIFPESTFDKLEIDWNAFRIFAGRHPDLGPRTTAALAPTDAAPTVRLAFTTSARPADTRVAAGARLPVDLKITSTAKTSVLVDVEIYNPAGEKVHQQAFDNQAFGPGETKVYTTFWSSPPDAAPGEYVVKIGVFTPGWGRLHEWNDTASKFTLGR
jgi:hypothetical protein